MNKVILIGRLTRDPELRETQTTNVCRYTLAVDRRFKKEGEPTSDFINCVVFGKSADFANKYFKKGLKVSVVGSLRTSSYTDNEGVKKYTTDVVVDEQHFVESKKEDTKKDNEPLSKENFTTSSDDDDMPF